MAQCKAGRTMEEIRVKKDKTMGFIRDEATKRLSRKENDKREYCGRIDK